jgi:hypothetical protein
MTTRGADLTEPRPQPHNRAANKLRDFGPPISDISSLQYFGITGRKKGSFTQNKARQISDLSTAIHIRVCSQFQNRATAGFDATASVTAHALASSEEADHDTRAKGSAVRKSPRPYGARQQWCVRVSGAVRQKQKLGTYRSVDTLERRITRYGEQIASGKRTY